MRWVLMQDGWSILERSAPTITGGYKAAAEPLFTFWSLLLSATQKLLVISAEIRVWQRRRRMSAGEEESVEKECVFWKTMYFRHMICRTTSAFANFNLQFKSCCFKMIYVAFLILISKDEFSVQRLSSFKGFKCEINENVGWFSYLISFVSCLNISLEGCGIKE